jgi:prephenate dehydratase
MKTFFLGPLGSYTHQAAQEIADKNTDFLAFSHIGDIFSAFYLDEDYGVIPVENSTEGSVSRTEDCLIEFPLIITAEKTLQIKHALISSSGVEKEDIMLLLSHEQSFAQCRKYLETYFPKAVLYPVSSNSKAAELLSNPKLLSQFIIEFRDLFQENKVGIIGPEKLAELYPLKVLENVIQDSQNNVTRFIKIQKNSQMPLPTGEDKTSFAFSTPKDKPGSLCDVLHLFSIAQINLNRIVSRPAKTSLGEYLFFIDCDGHIQDSVLSQVFEKMKQVTSFLKWLGSYPKERKIRC